MGGVETGDGVVGESSSLVGGVGEDCCELVFEDFLRRIGRTVNVSSTAGVVAGEDGVELYDTIGVGLLDTAEESGVQVGGIAGVAVAGGSHARVDTLYI